MTRRDDAAAAPRSPVQPVPDFLYLASQSPRRRQLLRQIGVRHELLLPDAGEDTEALEARRCRPSRRPTTCGA
jgi:septum formation protein